MNFSRCSLPRFDEAEAEPDADAGRRLDDSQLLPPVRRGDKNVIPMKNNVASQPRFQFSKNSQPPRPRLITARTARQRWSRKRHGSKGQGRVEQGNRCCIWNCWSLDLRIPLHLAETEANEAKQFKKAKQIRESVRRPSLCRLHETPVEQAVSPAGCSRGQQGAAGGSCMPTAFSTDWMIEWVRDWVSECVNEWMNELPLLLFACWVQRASLLYLRVFRPCHTSYRYHSCSHFCSHCFRFWHARNNWAVNPLRP